MQLEDITADRQQTESRKTEDEQHHHEGNTDGEPLDRAVAAHSGHDNAWRGCSGRTVPTRYSRVPALTDNTESRYAGVSWEMFRSGDWVTPRVYIEGKLVPFWAKPPLFFWMTALAFQLGGVSEWSARVPNLLVAAAMVFGTFLFGRRLWGVSVGALASLIVASSGLFFILSGTCVLDISLAASVFLGMASFALFAASEDNRDWWGRLFFLGLGIGCLAKGPVAVVLIGLAIGTWLLATGQLRLLRKLPWITGPMITGVITVPWYLMAEKATPGFLHYFLIQEHILRYIRSDYGDLYGSGRTQPYGASWVMLFLSFLPWSLFLIRHAFDRWRNRSTAAAETRDRWLLYAVIWGLTPAVFFTLCRQILITYLLPGIPGLALATAVVLVRWIESAKATKLLRGLKRDESGSRRTACGRAGGRTDDLRIGVGRGRDSDGDECVLRGALAGSKAFRPLHVSRRGWSRFAAAGCRRPCRCRAAD